MIPRRPSRVGTMFLACLALGGTTEPPARAGDKPLAADVYGDPLPAGAVARLGTVRFRHLGWHKSVAFSPDGKTVVSRAENHSLRFWETATGKLLGEIETEDTIFTAFAVSPDGKRIASAGAVKDGDDFPTRSAIRLWDAGTRKEVRTIKLENRVALSWLAFTPDGKTLLSDGGGLRAWEPDTGTELLRLQVGGGAFALSADGKLVAAAAPDGTLSVWEWQTDKEPLRIKAADRSGRGLIALAFSPDGKTLAGCYDIGSSGIRLWDVASGRLLYSLSLPEVPGHTAGLAFSPDGKLLAAADAGNVTGRNWSGAVQLWDVTAGTFLRELPTPGDSVESVAFSADGRWLAAGAESGVHVWDARTFEEVTGGHAGHRGHLLRVAVAGNLVATASDDHTVRLWDAATGKPLRTLRHDHWVRGLALSPDGSTLASSSLDDTLTLWDTASGKRVYRLPGHGNRGGKRTVAFTPDGRRCLSWGDDFYLRAWDVKTGKALLEHALRPEGVKVPGEDAEPRDRELFVVQGETAVSPDGKTFVLNAGNHFHVFDVATGKESGKIANEGGNVLSVAVSPDGKHLLASASGKAVLSADRRRISPAKEHPLCLWELATGKLVRRVMLAGNRAGPVAFSPDGKRFAVGMGRPEFKVRMWDVAGGEELRPLEGFRGRVTALAFTPDGKRLISGMDDTSALVWDLTAAR